MYRFTARLLLLLLTLFFAACNQAPQALPEGAVILAFGDGITSGTGAAAGEGFPEVLERLVGRRVVNAGVEGETTAAGRQRLPAVLAEVQPKLVILCHGGEDMTQDLEANQIIANLRAMVEIIGASGAEVLLVAVPPPAAHFQPASFYVQISRDLKTSIEVSALSNILSEKGLRSEGLHLNAQGYAALAKVLAKRVTVR